jgi:hypothetical protein
MKRKREWLALLSVTVMLFSSIEAQQRNRNSNRSASAARSSTTYDVYVGQYLLRREGESSRNAVIITITKVGNRLIAEHHEFGRSLKDFELFPLSGDTFMHKFKDEGTLSITFLKDVNGRVPQIKLTYQKERKDRPVSNQVVIVNRISSLIPYTPSSQQLSEYVGQYKIKKFPTRPPYNIILEGGVLFIEGGRKTTNGVVPKVGLFPDSKDRFLLKHSHAIFTFVRDERGKITHIEIVEPHERYVYHRL